MAPAEAMLIIKALAPGASLKYSEHTSQWYVSAQIQIGNGVTLTGITEHRISANDAVMAFLQHLQALDPVGDEFVVSSYQGHHREWRWNGGAFAECTREGSL